MADKRARVRAIVLDVFEGMFPDEWSEEQILETDPYEFDVDPSMHYEALEDRLGVPYDEDDHFTNYSGTVAHTIEFLTVRWDGETGA
jgi:hypothetical protein